MLAIDQRLSQDLDSRYSMGDPNHHRQSGHVVIAIPRLLLVAYACAIVQPAFAVPGPTGVDQPSNTPSELSESSPPTSAASAPAAAQAPAPTDKPAKLILVDNTLTAEQLKQILAAGYKPDSQARGNEVYFCRREHQLGTRFDSKICKTSQRILQDELSGKEMTSKAQRPAGNRAAQ